MSADFRLQNLEQHGVDADRDAFFLLDGRTGGEFGLHRFELDDGRGLDRSSSDDHGHDFLATGDAVREGFHRTQIGGDRALAAQRGVQLRQGRVGLVDHRDHRRRRRAKAVAHLVQHVLDLPAELAEGLGADQATAALQRVEDPADRLQTFDIVGFGFPRRQQLREIADLFFEFFKEDFPDFIVDVVAGDVETGRQRCRGRRRHGRRRSGRRCRSSGLPRRQKQGHERSGCRRCRHGRPECFDNRCFEGRRFRRWRLESWRFDGSRCDVERLDKRRFGGRFYEIQRVVHRHIGDRRRDVHRLGFRQLHGRRRGFRHDDLRERGRRHFSNRCSRAFGRQRPVTQGFETVAGDIEDIVAIGALFAQRFEVVLDAGECVRERVELTAVGNAAAFEQLDFRIQSYAVEILRGLRQLQDIERTGHIAQQLRYLGQFGVVPAGFDESDEGLARAREIGDRFADQNIQHFARFGAGQIVLGVGTVAAGEAGDLVVQRRVDVEKGTGHFQQRCLVCLALAIDDFAHRIALLQHQTARQPKTQHAEGIGHVLQAFGLRLKLDGIVPGRTQVQVQFVLHAQQVFLDRGGDGVEQRAIATRDAAAGVIEFGFGRLQRVEIEHFAQFHQRRVDRFAVRDVIQQLPGRLEGGIRARRIETALLEHAASFAIDAGEGLAKAGIHRERAIAQRGRDHRGHPQHAPLRFVGGAREQSFGREMQAFGIARRAAFRPRLQRVAQTEQVRRDIVGAAGGRLRRRARQSRRQIAIEIGDEQDAFAQTRFAAGGAQFVEHRQQDDRDFLVPALQTLQVIGQQHHTAHQRRAGDIAVGNTAVLQREGQSLHLLGHHRRGIEFDHPQGALHLVQQFGADPHPTGVGGVFGEAFDLHAHQTQGFVELGFDPAQRAVFDRIMERGHRAPPRTRSRPVSRSEDIRIISPLLRSIPPDQAGSLKSATERRRSAASCARFPIDSAVWFAPCEVCAVID